MDGFFYSEKYLCMFSNRDMVSFYPGSRAICMKPTIKSLYTENVIKDAESILLLQDDIDDPCVHVELQELSKYDREHLITWLKYRGDSLRHLDNMKQIRNRVLQYIENGQDKRVFDFTSDLRWIKKKANLLGIRIRKPNVSILPAVPDVLKNELGAIKSMVGWNKSLVNKPIFTTKHIHKYYEVVTKGIQSKSTVVKKHFERGTQLLEENFLSTNSIFARETENLFCVKGVCAASMKKENRWVTIALCKKTADVLFAYCQCASGVTGTCSHSFALMKLFAKWVLDNEFTIPEEIACTSKKCVWSVPQSRDRMFKSKVAELNIVSPDSSRKRKHESEEGNAKKEKKGIVSTMYEARAWNDRQQNMTQLLKFADELAQTNQHLPFFNVFNAELSSISSVETQFGLAPVGSVLSVQCPMIPPDFKVFSTFQKVPENDVSICIYPQFPLHLDENCQSEFLGSLSEQRKMFVEALQISTGDVDVIEKSTTDQAGNPMWFKHRKFRFTASLINKIRAKNPKTDKGFRSLAKSIVQPSDVSKTVQYKLDFGRFYEPIAIQRYEQYTKSIAHYVQVEKCGLVIDPVNYVLGATPDGKVIDKNEKEMFGIMEVKCSEEYKDFDPRSYIYICKSPCLEIIDGNLRLRHDHQFYDQIQMQLALTTRTWCDFIFFTLKGMIIDRIPFNLNHWQKLRSEILNFYFGFLINEYCSDKDI